MSNPHKHIKGALNLDGDPEHIKDYYSNWAVDYDRDVKNEAYSAPKIMLDCFRRVIDSSSFQFNSNILNLSIHDAGCGTGLVGKVFYAAGYKNISGSDLSDSMLEKARQHSIYTELTSGVDLNQVVRKQWQQTFDLVLCCGVFTSGHVKPESLLNLFNMTKKGGLVIVSTRTAYYDAMNFQHTSDKAIADGHATLLLNLLNAPYTNDGKAHYWVYKIL